VWIDSFAAQVAISSTPYVTTGQSANHPEAASDRPPGSGAWLATALHLGIERAAMLRTAHEIRSIAQVQA